VLGTLPANSVSRIVLEKLIGSQPVKKFHAFYGTHKLIITVTRAFPLCPYPEPNQSIPCLLFPLLEGSLQYYPPTGDISQKQMFYILVFSYVVFNEQNLDMIISDISGVGCFVIMSVVFGVLKVTILMSR